MSKLKVNLDGDLRERYRREGYWGDATLLDYWKMSALCFPEKTAVVDSLGTEFTYRELDRESDKLAGYLVRSGVEDGDVVSVQMANWAEFTLIYAACLKAGAVINPLMPTFRRTELLQRMGKCGSKVYITMESFRDWDYIAQGLELQKELPGLKKLVVVDKRERYPDTAGVVDHLSDILAESAPIEAYARAGADDVAVILFTSGTEGRAKGVMLTHNNICANQKGYVAMTHLSSGDTMLMPVPVAHATGLMYGVTIPFMTGMKSVLLERFNPEKSLELIEKHRCSVIMGPTVIAYDILRAIEQDNSFDLTSLKYFYCGGSPIPRSVLEKGMEHNIRILGVYGQTESAPHCVMSPYSSKEQVLKYDGHPIPGVEVKIVGADGSPAQSGEEGEEYSRGPNVFVGYVGEPEMTEAAFADGWLRSGDLCRQYDGGYIRVTGRKKDIIIRGGENLSSTEIEDLLLRIPAIKEAAVVGYPDERLGEKVCACLVLNEPSKPFTIQEMQRFMSDYGVAKYKWPERLEFLEALPRTESGKVEKYRLREWVKGM